MEQGAGEHRGNPHREVPGAPHPHACAVSKQHIALCRSSTDAHTAVPCGRNCCTPFRGTSKAPHTHVCDTPFTHPHMQQANSLALTAAACNSSRANGAAVSECIGCGHLTTHSRHSRQTDEPPNLRRKGRATQPKAYAERQHQHLHTKKNT